MKKLLLLILNICLVGSLNAEFFAVREATHPGTNKSVYILYDIHATVDPLSDAEVKEEYTKFEEGQEAAFNSIFSPAGAAGAGDAALPEYSGTIPFVKYYIEKYLPQHKKQRDDLKSIVKDRTISLVNEEWEPFDEGEMTMIDGVGFSGVELLLGDRQEVGKDKQLRLPMTPMRGLGRSLVGRHTIQSLQSLKDNPDIYFYNADARLARGLYSEEASSQVDDYILEGLERILGEKGKKDAIVSAGYVHSGKLAEKLREKGYLLGPLHTANSETVNKNPRLAAFLKNLEKYDDEEPGIGLSDTYELVSQPLDLQKTLLPMITDIEPIDKDGDILGDFEVIEEEDAAPAPAPPVTTDQDDWELL